MPAYGRTIGSTNLIASSPRLPVPLYAGSLQFSVSFEGHPSGSIEYQAVTERQIRELETVYGNSLDKKKPLKFKIEGVLLQVNGFSYTREPFSYKNGRYETYSASVSLVGGIQSLVEKKIAIASFVVKGRVGISRLAKAAKVDYEGPNFSFEPTSEEMSVDEVLRSHCRRLGCFIEYSAGKAELKKFDDGVRTWTFAEGEITSDGAHSLSVPPAYNNLEVTCKLTEEPETDPENPEGQEFKEKKPVIEILVEEDDAVEEPPEGTTVLRSLDSNFDVSGPKKTRKTTTQQDGITIKEVIEIWGFSYLWEEVDAGDGLIFSDTPSAFWKMVERKESNYVYEKLPLVSYVITAKEPEPNSTNVVLIMDPIYNKFADLSSFGGVSGVQFKTSAEYLTKVVTTGWRLTRFEKETPDSNTLDIENPRYNLMKFFKQPLQEQTAYKMNSVRKEDKDLLAKEQVLPESDRRASPGEIGLPFSIEWVNRDEVAENLKDQIPMSYSGKRVGVLTPDPAFVEPLVVKTESRRVNCFAWKPDPDAAFPDNPLPPLMTGEESYFRSDRVMVRVNRYREKSSNFSSQESGFLRSLEQVNFREALGRPPEASARTKQWAQTEPNEDTTKNPPDKKVKRLFLTSDLVTDETPVGGSASYETVETLDELRKAALIDLRISGMEGSQSSRTVSWYYPTMRGGDRLVAGRDRFTDKGRWRIMGASFSLEFEGANNLLNRLLITTGGTSLTLGLDRPRKLEIEEKEQKVPGDQGQPGDPKILIRPSYEEHSLGEILKNVANRRNF